MNKVRVLLQCIKRAEEHGQTVTYAAGTVIAVGANVARAWEEAGDCVILDKPGQRGDLPPWEIKRKQAVPVNMGERGAQVLRRPGRLAYDGEGTSGLVARARAFWYNNDKTFQLDVDTITRAQVWQHGGPSARLDSCPTCQRMEWQSRLFQQDFYEVGHRCPVAAEAEFISHVQGDDRWRHLQQDFTFANGISGDLRAPKCVYVLSDRWYNAHFEYGGSHVTLNKRRGLARACQVDVRRESDWHKIEWAKYDFLYMNNSRQVPLLPVPPIPILMYGHDHWKGNPQETLDHYKPDILITPFRQSWIDNMQIPAKTDVRLYAIGASSFYSAPNVDGPKAWDLLCIGALSKGERGPYGPRIALHEQIEGLPQRYSIHHSHVAQFGKAEADLPNGPDRTLLNYYSAFLGNARFVIFGPCQGMAKDALLIKFYECLACGAVPIMPEVPDLALLGVEPGVHFISVEGVDNDRLMSYLDHYPDYAGIARAAASWHEQNADELLFGGFEQAVRDITGGRYPARVVS